MSKKITLVLGGAASGKSAFAESHMISCGKSKIYLATAQCFDTEMSDKIEQHKSQRGSGWKTIEAPFDLLTPLAAIKNNECVLVDCITMWLSNHLLKHSDIDHECDRLITALAHCAGQITLVSNEVGQGIVPENALARQFRNLQGHLNQRLAVCADTVVFITAGLPCLLKGKL